MKRRYREDNLKYVFYIHIIFIKLTYYVTYSRKCEIILFRILVIGFLCLYIFLKKWSIGEKTGFLRTIFFQLTKNEQFI